jgi:hypothetical protein
MRKYYIFCPHLWAGTRTYIHNESATEREREKERERETHVPSTRASAAAECLPAACPPPPLLLAASLSALFRKQFSSMDAINLVHDMPRRKRRPQGRPMPGGGRLSLQTTQG